ncbi:MAG: hypothetical protein KGZ60_04420 [Truepera sp.]|nr:hypothetical protein [Truepera sp.]
MIGARFALYPMTADFVPVILKALEAMSEFPLERKTDDISTFLSGEEGTLFKALAAAFEQASAGGEHVVMSLTLSRGCPGEPGEDRCDPTPAQAEAARPEPRASGPQVACQFSLYPLGLAGYMEVIYQQVAAAQRSGAVKVVPQHFCTRLEGPLAAVLGQLRTAFDQAAVHTPHVVIHATLSAHSPTGR